MVVRRFLTGVLAIGLAVPILAAAPREGRGNRAVAQPQPPAGMGTRVFARADGGSESPAPAAVAAPDGPGPAAKPSAEIAARARAEFDANRAGKIDRSHYTSDMNGVITEDALAKAASTLQSLGMVKSFGQVRRIAKPDLTIYIFRIEFADPSQPPIEEAVAWNAAGKIAFLSFGAGR